MKCVSCTALIDYVLVNALEHILAAPLLILFFFLFSGVFSILCLLYIVLLVVFSVDYFLCENNFFLKKNVVKFSIYC